MANILTGLGNVAMAFVRLRNSVKNEPREEYEARATPTEVLLRVTAEEQEQRGEQVNADLLSTLSEMIKRRAGDDATVRLMAREFYYRAARARGACGCAGW